MGGLLEGSPVKLLATSAQMLAQNRTTYGNQLPCGPRSLISIADDDGLRPEVIGFHDRLDLAFNDALHDRQGVCSPRVEHARRILEFAESARGAGVDSLVVQCQAGIGRSHAVCMALEAAGFGHFGMHSLTYNRKLFSLILKQAGKPQPVEPLVSVAVRAKYGPEALTLFLLSLRAQRYDSWEAIVFTDGPDEDSASAARSLCDDRIRVIQTAEPKGRWGHPYRQMAFECANGEWVCTNNDDNYLTPGFLEQLTTAGRFTEADVVVCQCLHRYSAWAVIQPGADLCCWIARADLVRKVPWEGSHFTADANYLERLIREAGKNKVAYVNRPLVVKN